MYPVLEIGAHSGNSMVVGMAKFQIQIRKVFGQVHYWLRNFWIFWIKKQFMLSEHPDKNENENEILWSEIRMITDATIGKVLCLPWLECLSSIPSDQLYFIITHVPPFLWTSTHFSVKFHIYQHYQAFSILHHGAAHLPVRGQREQVLVL